MRLPTLPSALATLLAFLPIPALAQRHLWLVPGTAGRPFEGVCWDPGPGRILAASGDAILEHDPVTGAQKILHRTRSEGGALAQRGPRVLDLVLDPAGAIDFTTEGPERGESDGRIWRLEPDGKARVIAGRNDEGPFIGEAKDALEGRFRPADLAVGPDGARYVADEDNGRVLLLEPRPGDGAGFSLRIIAGPGAGEDPDAGDSYDPDLTDGQAETDWPNEPLESQFLNAPAPDPDPSHARIRPRALAAAPDGTVFLADWSSAVEGRPPQVFQLDPEARDAGPGWAFRRLPVPGEAGCECPPGQEQLPVRKPHRLAVGEDGTLYILGHGLIWSYTPLETREGEHPDPQWRCEAVAGPLSPKGSVDAWPPSGAPADQLDPAVLGRIWHMAAVPGGGLLLTDGVDGIRFLGPPGDAGLGARLRAHARARAAGDPGRAKDILARLERQRDSLEGEPFDLPFRSLCKAATVSPRLDRDVLELIGSFLVDPSLANPRLLAFRAAMAAAAIRAGGDPGLDPAERILAQRHVWQVPFHQETSFGPVAWDSTTGTLVAICAELTPRADGRRTFDHPDQSLLCLDPVRGTSKVLHTIPPRGAAPVAAGPPPGHRFVSVAVGPGGAIYAISCPDGNRSWQLWRLAPGGGLNLLAGGEEIRNGINRGAFVACGPGDELFVADGNQLRVLRLEPTAGEGWDLQPIARGIKTRCLALALGAGGDVLLGDENGLTRLLPQPGPSGRAWRAERVPAPGTPEGGILYYPSMGSQYSPLEITSIAPAQDGGFHVVGDIEGGGTLCALEPVPVSPAAATEGSAQRWRCQPINVAGRHTRLPDDWDGDLQALPPGAPDHMICMTDLAGIPGGGLAISNEMGNICFIGPPGDGALFAQVLAFRTAEAGADWATARRILGALLRQRRLADGEACELPFRCLARTGAADAPPRLGRLDRLPRTLRRLVGTFLVRPKVMAFRAALAAEAILAESEWAKDWVAKGCPTGGEGAEESKGPGRKKLREEAKG